MRVFVAVGSNLGDRPRHLEAATCLLRDSIRLLAASPVYETAPMYVQDQPPFLNAALLAETELGPLELLRVLKEIERRVGRVPGARFGPREIDLDLVSYGSAAYRFVDRGRTVLEVPHPRSPERAFVLRPLADVEPHLVLPGLGSVRHLLDSIDSCPSTVRRLEHVVLPL